MAPASLTGLPAKFTQDGSPGDDLERKAKLVGTVRCAVSAPFRRGTTPCQAFVLTLFIPPAGRGRGQRSALSLPPYFVRPTSDFEFRILPYGLLNL